MNIPLDLGEATDATSFRLIDVQRIGFITSIRVMRHRIAGFQNIAVNMPRAADGVITS